MLGTEASVSIQARNQNHLATETHEDLTRCVRGEKKQPGKERQNKQADRRMLASLFMRVAWYEVVRKSKRGFGTTIREVGG
jgi:hypothetical protein